jgi:hypothetical protein
MKLIRIALGSMLLTALLGCASGGEVQGDDDDGSAGVTPSGPCLSCDAGTKPESGATGDGGGPSLGLDSGSPPMTSEDASDLETSFLADTGTTSVDSGGGTDDTACGTEATESACANCCASDNPSSVPTLNSAIQTCVCGTAGPCATACATEVCVGSPATSGDACYTCLSSALGASGSCYAPVHTACAADPGCAAYLTCEMMECAALPM